MKSLLLTSMLVLATLSLLRAQPSPPLLISFGSSSISNPTNDPFHQQADTTAYTSWNMVQTANVMSGLVYGDGTPATGVSIQLGANINSFVNFSIPPTHAGSPGMGPFTQTPYTTSFSTGSPGTNAIWYGSTPTTQTSLGAAITGLPAGTYQVFVTGVDTGNPDNPASPAGTEIENFYYSTVSTIPATNTRTSTGALNPKPLVETLNLPDTYPWLVGNNYITFTVTVASTDHLIIYATGEGTTVNNAFLNSIEIVPVADMARPVAYGLNTHEALDSAPVYWTTLNLPSFISQSGVNMIRDGLYWQDCERTKGTIVIPPDFITFINGEVAAGISPVIVLAYGNTLYDSGYYPTDSVNQTPAQEAATMQAYANFCKAVVTQFKGKVKYYSVWNEWGNNQLMPSGCPTATITDYVPLLQLVYPQLKAIDPNIVVLSTSIDGGDGTLTSGLKAGMAQCSDAVDLHPYDWNGTDPYAQIENWYTRMQGEAANILAANNQQPFPLYVSEMGWPTQINGGGLTEEEQAQYLSRCFILTATLPSLRGLIWYELRDTFVTYASGNFTDNQGVLRADCTPKLSWSALQDTMTLLKGATFVDQIQVRDPNVFLLRFKEANGNYFIAAWSEWAQDDWQVLLKMTSGSQPAVNVTSMGHVAFQTKFSTSAGSSTLALNVTLRRNPVIIEGPGVNNVSFWQIYKKPFNETLRTPNAPTQTSPYLPLGQGNNASALQGSNVSPF